MHRVCQPLSSSNPPSTSPTLPEHTLMLISQRSTISYRLAIFSTHRLIQSTVLRSQHSTRIIQMHTSTQPTIRPIQPMWQCDASVLSYRKMHNKNTKCHALVCFTALISFQVILSSPKWMFSLLILVGFRFCFGCAIFFIFFCCHCLPLKSGLFFFYIWHVCVYVWHNL